MKQCLLVLVMLCALQLGAQADVVRLISGKTYNGAVVSWSGDEISFVLQGGAVSDAFTIPARLIESVTLPDSSVHQPGTDSWIAVGRITQLPWEQQRAAKISAAPASVEKTEPVNVLSLKNYVLQLALTGAMQAGYTTYQISFPWDPYGDVGESRLDFPLDGYQAGIKASVLSRPAKDRHLQYGIDLDFAWRLSDPHQDMTDSDWARTSSGDYQYVYSATKSTSQASGWEMTAAVTALYPAAEMLKVGGLLGYHYLHQSYDIYGVAGWQDPTFMTTGTPGDRVYFDELRTTRVGQYTVSYKLPMLGLELLSESAEGFTLRARGAYLFSAAADDEDRHLLRNKMGTCSASGSGWQLGADAWLRLATLSNKSILSLGGSYEYLKVDTKGSQTQTWYGDDPATPGDDTGYSITGIDDKLFIYRHAFGVFVTYTF